MKNKNHLVFINKGKRYISSNDYFDAIMTFKEGLSCSHNPIFNLYIAICYFKLNDYFTSMTYLKIYESVGKEYLEICYLFLAAIYKNIKDNRNCYYYYQKFLGKDKIDNYEVSNGVIESHNKLIDTKVENVYKLIFS